MRPSPFLVQRWLAENLAKTIVEFRLARGAWPNAAEPLAPQMQRYFEKSIYVHTKVDSNGEYLDPFGDPFIVKFVGNFVLVEDSLGRHLAWESINHD